jgi:HEAT repeat protein
LRDSDPVLRESALRIVGYIGYCSAFKDLLSCCHDENIHVRQAAIEGLPAFEGHKQVIPLLTEALEKGEAKIRAAAARALTAIDDSSVISLLESALSDSYLWTRYFAAQALGEHGAIESVESLSKIASNSKEAMPVRLAATEALGKIGDNQVIATLTKLIQSEEDIDLITKALNALGKIGAEAPLLTILESADSAVIKRKAIHALKHIKTATVVTKLQAQVRIENNAEITQDIIETLKHIGTSEAIYALITLTISQEWRETCINILSKYEIDKIELIAAGLQHEHPAARSATVRILAQLKKPSEDLIIKALDDKEVSVRLTAVTALKSLNIKEAELKLLEMADEEPNIVVRRAVQKLLTN